VRLVEQALQFFVIVRLFVMFNHFFVIEQLAAIYFFMISLAAAQDFSMMVLQVAQ